MNRRIGIDIGGTKIAAAAFSPAGEMLFERRIATPSRYHDIVTAVAELAKQAGEGSVGIGAPGSTAQDTGLWRNANITVCNGKPFHADLALAIGRPVRTENDANCFALSEAVTGAGKSKSVVAFFTIGTGLGGGLVVDGKLLRGSHREAAEFGHMSLPWMTEADWPPHPCFCGKAGCVEMYVSGTGLRQDWQRLHGETLEAPDIVSRARQGDAHGLAAISRLQVRFARVIAQIINAVDPDIFIMGGGMAQLPELVEQMPEHVAPYSFSGTAKPLIARATFADSGVRGAALLWD